MLKKLFKTIISSKAADASDTASVEPTIISRDNHCISRKQISKSALTVMYDLRKAGYEAYLVGGGVRDLLLGLAPKDFDVATNATPEQVLQHFRRARIVGRRFKIAHVRFGREIIEVTTFRAGHEQLENKKGNNSSKSETNDQGMLLRDNVYGNLRDDALRRDFTINALYYSIDGFTVLDYVNGLDDLQHRLIRIIGDASQRYAEDPVRMLRAIRFKAKFDFELEQQTAAPMRSLGHLLNQVAPPRLFDEAVKIFLNGHGRQAFELLVEYQLFDTLFPVTAPYLHDHSHNDGQNSVNTGEHYYQLICNALNNTDQRVQDHKPVTPAFLFAALLWPAVCEDAVNQVDSGAPRLRALQIAGHNAVDGQIGIIAIPKRFSIAMREIWTLQQRLETAHGKRAIAVLQHPKFRAAYDFLLLREQTGESLDNRGEFWTQLQIEHPVERQHTPRPENGNRRRRRPRNKDKPPAE